MVKRASETGGGCEKRKRSLVKISPKGLAPCKQYVKHK